MKYSEVLADWLKELGYTHCFYINGGNNMHLVQSCNKRFICVPFIHEVSAGISAEYFNEASSSKKAFALVTAGPGLTNIVTAIAGAHLESRELLVIGGQVKTTDLRTRQLRQRGIQEIPGKDIVKPITLNSEVMKATWSKKKFYDFVFFKENSKKGSKFLEIPIDIQGKDFVDLNKSFKKPKVKKFEIKKNQLNYLKKLFLKSKRPVILIGGGIDRNVSRKLSNSIKKTSIPFITTWNGADRIGSSHPNYFGRSNTWGQRRANIIIQQSDLVLALGTRLGLQQTGFNWQEFVPKGKIIHVDIDQEEIKKGHPNIYYGIQTDANLLLKQLLKYKLGNFKKWFDYCSMIKSKIPLIEKNANKKQKFYVSPFEFYKKLSEICKNNDIIVPCSSGGALTTFHQTFEQKQNQIIISNKGLAAMGYGLGGALGSSFANRNKRVILIEGDGGFAQNLQEIGTVAINKCNIKMFIFDDSGYASIRMTQRNYFKGNYVGCDKNTGLGLPQWDKVFNPWGIKVIKINYKNFKRLEKNKHFNSNYPVAFIVSISPNQTYFPKISSKVLKNGKLVSNPIHLMSPDLDKSLEEKVFKYI
tara:strand:+ start:582 stop:2339 length:1758 start_codon:yes stop_codon:yes gene_type:complete